MTVGTGGSSTGTRVCQLAADGGIGKSTCYARLHEAIDLLAALAPDVHEALLAAKAAGLTHVNIDGTYSPSPSAWGGIA